ATSEPPGGPGSEYALTAIRRTLAGSGIVPGPASSVRIRGSWSSRGHGVLDRPDRLQPAADAAGADAQGEGRRPLRHVRWWHAVLRRRLLRRRAQPRPDHRGGRSAVVRVHRHARHHDEDEQLSHKPPTPSGRIPGRTPYAFRT